MGPVSPAWRRPQRREAGGEERRREVERHCLDACQGRGQQDCESGESRIRLRQREAALGWAQV
jgi:hypothetical protein